MMGDVIWTWWLSAHYAPVPRKSEAWSQPEKTFLYRTAVILVGWEVFHPVLPLSRQLCYAQAISWDEEGLIPAMDVGMGESGQLCRGGLHR